jgi:hypothetical protein
MSISQAIVKIYQQIPSEVRLIAVTKHVEAKKIRETYQTTKVRDFAENKLQEVLAKKELLKDIHDICWHFIGHLQTNKVRKVLEEFDWIHSVDNLDLLLRINRIAEETQASPHICLQIKPLPDPNKFGWNVEQLKQEISQIESLGSIRVRGLMTILPLGLSHQEKLDAFSSIRDLAISISQSSTLVLDQLSMGMSNDYLEAVQSGSTMIRLGQAIYNH